jgi:hypothetical protein
MPLPAPDFPRCPDAHAALESLAGDGFHERIRIMRVFFLLLFLVCGAAMMTGCEGEVGDGGAEIQIGD